MARKPKTRQSPELLAAFEAQRVGRVEEAARRFKQVLDRQPRNAEALHGYGLMMGKLGHLRTGIEFIGKAIRIEGNRAEFHHNLGTMHRMSGDLPRAVESYERASWLDKAGAEVCYSLAATYDQMHRLDEARAALGRALQRDPRHANALIMAEKLKLRDAGDFDPEASARLLSEITGRERDPEVLQFAWRTLGDVLQKLGKWRDAFEAYRQSNEVRKANPMPPRSAMDEYLKRIETNVTDTSQEMFRRWKEEPIDDGLPTPAFLLGFPRSGTTMTERVLDAHPDVYSLEERPYHEQALKEMRRWFEGQGLSEAGMLDRLTTDQVRRLRSLYWKELLEEHPGAEGMLVLDKLPLRTTRLPTINRLFPDARIIFALRDPRDVCLSCFVQHFMINVAMSFFLDLEDTATLYARTMRQWIELRDRLSAPWIEVRYEDTVTDLEKQARRILDFLGLGWDPSVLTFHERTRERSSATPSYEAITKPVNTKAIGKWRRYAEEMEPVLPILEPYVQAFGYEPSGVASHTG